MEATLSVNEDKIEINQKIDHDKNYSFGNGQHLFHVRVHGQEIEIATQEKKGVTLSPFSKGLIRFEAGKEATMTKTNDETKEVSTFIVKLSKI